ncbi:PRD domain-containing protein [[Eubacterium] hominis]|uniref:PRD domain-containing protein n=1 Tax=[Eubacterium] hominis TaxID=2764325 RepID=UPI003A4E30A4
MKITKIFNNNLVATITPDKREALLSGTGIGFGKKTGDQVDHHKITSYYYMENQRKKLLYQIMETTPVIYLEIAEAILEKATMKLQKNIQESLLPGLVDHLYVAVMRAKQGKTVPNLILTETSVMYPMEYEVGKWALRYIKAHLGVDLPEDEAGFIAIHIQNAEDDSHEDVSDMLMFVKETIDILEETFHLKLDITKTDYLRLTSHLKFFYQRMMKLQTTTMVHVEDMYSMLLKKHRDLPLCMERLDRLLVQEYGYHSTLSEKVYLMMHILKMIQ